MVGDVDEEIGVASVGLDRILVILSPARAAAVSEVVGANAVTVVSFGRIIGRASPIDATFGAQLDCPID